MWPDAKEPTPDLMKMVEKGVKTIKDYPPFDVGTMPRVHVRPTLSGVDEPAKVSYTVPFVCLNLCTCWPVHPSVCLDVHWSVYPPDYLSVTSSVQQSICLVVRLSKFLQYW